MTTSTPTIRVTFVQAATILAAHLADHTLPEPAALRVNTRGLHSEVTVQLRSTNLPTVATDLLAWVDTLPVVTVEAWRVPTGDSVHLSIASTLTGPTGSIKLDVFGAVDHHPARFADLEAGDRQTVALGQLCTWAALDGPGAKR